MPHEPWSLVGQYASVRFTLRADPSAGLLPRIIQPFARRDLVPDCLEARLGADGCLHVEIALERMPAEMVHLIEGNLRQIIEVQSLSTRQELTGRVCRTAA